MLTEATTQPGAPRALYRGVFRSGRSVMARYGIIVALAVLIIGFSIALPDTFATSGNFQTILSSQAVILLLAIAATIPLRAGDFDLSVAAVLTLTGAITAVLLKNGAPLLVAFLAAIAAGVVVGLFHALVIVKLGVDSFITTLGTLTVLTGGAYAITGSQIVSGMPDSLSRIATTNIFNLQSLVWISWAIVIVCWYVYERTPIGRSLLFVGGSRDSARLAGIRVGRVRSGAFLASAVVCSVAGFLFVADIGSLDPSVGSQLLLQPFSAAFLGATAITVGRFNAIGTMFGLYLVVVGVTGLQLLGVQSWVSDVFNGAALVVAVTVARIARQTQGTRT